MSEKSSAKPAGRPIAGVPKERLEFRRLLASNPNYFGNLDQSSFKAVNKVVGNTTYEEATCVGFNPALDLLEATVHIKRPTGYLGTLCTPGSTEYVRFFIDYGAGWVGAGMSSFNAHDIPNTVDCARGATKPLIYVVTQALDPSRRNCRTPVVPMVRAILSWQNPPPAGNPNWTPVWGNVLDQNIQIKPRRLWFGDVLNVIPKEALKDLPPFIEEAKPVPIPTPDPSPMALSELAKLYGAGAEAKARAQAVEPHRFALAHVQPLLGSADQPALAAAGAEWKKAGLDLAAIIAALDETSADTSYEQLDCLGLEYNLERLVATFRVKRPTGYSGGLCTAGSKEYVAFWADWDDTCEWTYLNTVAVNVHDITPHPAGDIAYSAILPVDLNAVRRPCGGRGGGPKIARIRAVLSWNTPPSTTDPDALTHWGNRVDAHVQIRPGMRNPEGQPVISIIGGIGIAGIGVFGNGLTTPAATFAVDGSSPDSRGCPFGGRITVQGPPTPGFKYRLWARESGKPATEQVVTNPFFVVNWLGVGGTVAPNPMTGYVAYLDTLSNINQVLAWWKPPGDELWEIRLEMATLAEVVFGTTPWYRVQLDNTAPRRRPPLSPFEPPEVTCEIHIDSGGDCKDFSAGTLIQGHFTARDTYFGSFALSTLPSSMAPNTPTTPTPFTSQTASFAAGGDEWSLNTAGMKACGYVIVLNVWDRAIVNSVPGQHNWNYFDVGFCLTA